LRGDRDVGVVAEASTQLLREDREVVGIVGALAARVVRVAEGDARDLDGVVPRRRARELPVEVDAVELVPAMGGLLGEDTGWSTPWT
jgi:hypothetical protein